MSEALTRIQAYLAAFSEAIERCRTATTFNAADWQDAYNRLNRLRDRYITEKPNLEPSEGHALDKVFERDTFIEGMLDIRQVGEHVHNRSGPVIRSVTNQPIPLIVETSAMSVFSARTVELSETSGQLHSIDHLHNLTEAENRIQRALTCATNKQR